MGYVARHCVYLGIADGGTDRRQEVMLADLCVKLERACLPSPSRLAPRSRLPPGLEMTRRHHLSPHELDFKFISIN